MAAAKGVQLAEAAQIEHGYEDPFVALRATDADRQALLDAVGATWTREQVARHLGLISGRVAALESSGLVALARPGTVEVAYPAWQFSQHGLQPWLEPVTQAFRESGMDDPWVQADFLLSGNAFLQDRAPLETLQAGDTGAALRAIRRYGHQAAP